MSDAGKLVIYSTEDGKLDVRLRIENGSAWLTQAEMADLFSTSTQAITQLIKAIYEEEELQEGATCKDSLQVRIEGAREVKRSIKSYNLDLILAVGYRVRSIRGTQFRQWATANLREYLVKGFVLNDERLKNPGQWDYFDELLARIREIRASEKRFYQKVRDLFALSSDYRDSLEDSMAFFAEVQNKMLYSVTGQTAAEIIVSRADPAKPNMNLTAWKGSRVRKEDVIVAKNYPTSKELDTLNRLVSMFLDQAEMRAQEHKQLTLDFWRANVVRLLEFNDRPVLKNAGSISHEKMLQIADKRYEEFDENRRAAEALAADAEDIKLLEGVEKKLLKKKGKK